MKNGTLVILLLVLVLLLGLLGGGYLLMSNDPEPRRHGNQVAGTPDNTESTFGIHAYGPVLCQSKTGVFGMWNAKDSYWVSFHDDVTYDVDALVPLTSAGHPEGLLKALSTYFK